MGESEASIAKQAMRFSGKLPDGIENAPVLEQGSSLYYNAFFDLSSERVNGMSMGAIPWSAIQAYAMAHDLTAEQTETMHAVLRQMDAVYLKRK